MSAATSPIVVGFDGSDPARAAVRWATTEAVARGVPLRIVCAYHWMVRYIPVPMFSSLEVSDRSQHQAIAERMLADAAREAQQQDASVKVDVAAVGGTPTDVLVEESASAGMVVLGSAALRGHDFSVVGSVSAHVVARSSCPAVVVRSDPPAQGAIVAGVDGTESAQHVLDYAFHHASIHNAPLLVVLAWRLDLPKLLEWRSEPSLGSRAEAWLAEALAGWREEYPDVVVEEQIVEDQPSTALVRASAGQRLLVVGRHGHRATIDTMLGSVSQSVLHHAVCPVAVLPPSA